jgi:NAD(P)-dependent dehydrogenase (short-subunit alcohol dehydrogenase family)
MVMTQSSQINNEANESTSTSNTSRRSSSPSPYYSLVHFSLMIPIAIVHTLVSHAVLWLTGAKLTSSTQPQRLLDHGYPWQTASTGSLGDDTKNNNGVAIVTGSNTGIGFHTARSLVLEHGMIVILACRSRDKATAAVAKINSELQQQQQGGSSKTAAAAAATTKTGGAMAIFVYPLDLSSFDSVREFARVVRQQYKEIHVLVNNAGRGSLGVAGQSSLEKVVRVANGEQQRQEVVELDLLFQSNFLGHFLLTRLLLKDNMLAKNARIVNLSSVMHHFCGGVPGGLDLESPSGWKSVAMAHQRPLDTYSFSKLAAILFTIELNRRHYHNAGNTSTMIRSIAVNPGAV